MADESPKLHIDSDWKAQAQAEKEKLTREADAPKAGQGAAGGPGRMPKADFPTLISTMATQALFAMGLIPDPRSGQRMQSMDLARHHIDMLGVIEDKTKGNLDEEEANMLAQTLYELRQHYIQMAQGSGR